MAPALKNYELSHSRSHENLAQLQPVNLDRTPKTQKKSLSMGICSPKPDRGASSYHKLSWWEMSRHFTILSVPTVVTCFFLSLIYMINIVYAGRFGDSATMAGVGLGTTFLNIICLIPLRGVNRA